MKDMRSGRRIIPILLLLAVSPWLRGQSFFPTELELDPFEQSYARLDLGNLDISGLLREAGENQPSMAGEDACQLVRRNVSYIIFHKLNRDRLFMVPDGQYIVDKATEIYGSLNRIGNLITEGRAFTVREIRSQESLRLMNELRKTARGLRRNFRQYFVELSEAEYEFEIKSKSADQVQMMLDYLEECDKVNSQLRFTLDRFFFNPAPGIVTVDDYSAYSVALLSRSLEVLSDSFSDRLAR